MSDLRECLYKEQCRLEEILQNAEERLRNAPKGTLRLSKSGRQTQYYCCRPGGKKNGVYIPKAEKEWIQKLAQKAYDEKVVRLVRRRLPPIRKLAELYQEDPIETLFLSQCKERQRWIRAAEPTWEQRVAEWKTEAYIGKGFQANTPFFVTEQGEQVRSKSEKILADYFFKRGIAYKYERPLQLKGLGTIYPDYTLLSEKTRQEIYWEHFGRMGDPVYAQKTVWKIQAYEENGIFPGETILFTFETDKSVLDMRLVEALTDKYLAR